MNPKSKEQIQSFCRQYDREMGTVGIGFFFVFLYYQERYIINYQNKYKSFPKDFYIQSWQKYTYHGFNKKNWSDVQQWLYHVIYKCVMLDYLRLSTGGCVHMLNKPNPYKAYLRDVKIDKIIPHKV